jgi:hypothetical protein
MARLTAPSGATVSVADEKVDTLVRQGFVLVPEKKAPAKPAASKK